jgi:DNA repair protein RAD51
MGDDGLLDATSMYIDSNGNLRPERLIAIATRFQLEPAKALDAASVGRVYNTDHLVELIIRADAFASEHK